MDGKRQKFQLRRQRHNRQRILAFCLIFSLVLSNLNFGSMLTYATEGNRRTFEIGSDVKAVLKDGVLYIQNQRDLNISEWRETHEKIRLWAYAPAACKR